MEKPKYPLHLQAKPTYNPALSIKTKGVAVLVGLSIALLVSVLDQLSKILIFGYLSETAPVIEVTSFFNIVTAWNTGVSFSMFNDLGVNGVYILSSFALLVAGALIYWLKNEDKRYMQIALGMVIGGAIGNVIDRIRLGAVFDFLDIHAFGYHWPAFNVADSFICIGAFLIILDGLCNKNCTKSQNFHEGIDQ